MSGYYKDEIYDVDPIMVRKILSAQIKVRPFSSSIISEDTDDFLKISEIT